MYLGPERATDSEGFCGSEREYRFKWSILTAASSTGTAVITTAYLEIDSDEDDPDSPCSGFGSPADKGGIPSESTQPSQFDAAGYLDFTKGIDAVGLATFMRFETEGAATEQHRWNEPELQKSPFAKLVFRETTGAKRRAWLQRRVPGMRRPTSNLGPTSPHPMVRMRSQLEDGWGAGGKRMKAVFNLESEVGRSMTDFTSELVLSSFQLGVMSCPMSKPRRTRTASCAFSALSSKNFSVRVSTGMGCFVTVDLQVLLE